MKTRLTLFCLLFVVFSSQAQLTDTPDSQPGPLIIKTSLTGHLPITQTARVGLEIPAQSFHIEPSVGVIYRFAGNKSAQEDFNPSPEIRLSLYRKHHKQGKKHPYKLGTMLSFRQLKFDRYHVACLEWEEHGTWFPSYDCVNEVENYYTEYHRFAQIMFLFSKVLHDGKFVLELDLAAGAQLHSIEKRDYNPGLEYPDGWGLISFFSVMDYFGEEGLLPCAFVDLKIGLPL